MIFKISFEKIVLILTIFCFLISCVDKTVVAPRTDDNVPSLLNDPVNTTDLSKALVVNEIGSAYYIDGSTWIEIYNRSSLTVKLSSFKIRCTSIAATTYQSGVDITYDLPAYELAPGNIVLLRGIPLYIPDAKKYFQNTGNTIFLTSGGSYSPGFTSTGNGFVEILHNKATVDFVRFGTSTVTPSTGSFKGTAPAVLATSVNGYGYSIKRDGSSSDTDNSSDWSYSSVATPGGPNDVTDATDADADGIPDACEVSGSTFAGMPLYDWGARPGRKDIFIHVDYMDSTDPGIKPKIEALTKVRDQFRLHNIEVHFDVGNLYGTGGVNEAEFRLSDTSHLVPFNKAVIFAEYIDDSRYVNLYNYKNAYMPSQRLQIFHYLLMASSIEADGSAGSSGIAELPGNDVIIALGQWFSTSTAANIVINFQASTIMHELGHNLGLRHGGSENNNYKPNYLSVMNYMYQLSGLPQVGSNWEGDRFYYQYSLKGITSLSQLSNSPYSSPSLFGMDYSDGTSTNLVESSINESKGLGRSNSVWIDYNANSSIETALSKNLNASWSTTSGETLTDYNDWGNINLLFQRFVDGSDTGSSVTVALGFFVYRGLTSDAQSTSGKCVNRVFIP